MTKAYVASLATPAQIKYEWPVTIERAAGGYETSLVKFMAPEGASRATLNELAVKRARELGHTTARPFYQKSE